MKKFFGSSNNGDDNGDQAAAGRTSESHDEPPPDEHTRLLPNRVSSVAGGGYLSPDDPAVSPYNLWTVRIVRWLTLFFAAISFLWWVVQLVAAFVTPPGFHTRGSGFFSFSYSSLALTILVITLLFFAAPSKAWRVLSAITAVLLAANMIVILAVENNRHEEAWVGVASVVWALLISLWSIITDRTVEWGKGEEEQRLTGRSETRRTLFEWTKVLLSTIALLVVTIVVVLMTCTLILRSLDAGLAPPGDRYWVDGDQYQIHLYCRGNKTDSNGRVRPTVLFEGGERPVEDGLWQFANDAINNGSITRYCFADRPGFAWSDTAPSPLSAGQATEALSEALARAGEEGPWVLASAGIGSIYSRIFSSRHGRDIEALVMIDPLHEDLLGRVGAGGRGFLLWLRGVFTPLGLDRIPAALFKGRTREDRVWGRAWHQSGKGVFARLQESLVADSLTRRDVESSRAIQSETTPVVVVSSGAMIRGDEGWADKQRDLAHLTRELRHWDIVDGAPHEVWRSLEGREMIEKRLRELVMKKQKS